MKIFLIEPKSPNYHIYSRFKLPRLGLVMLGTILKEQGHEVKLYLEEVADININEVLDSELVGISTTSSTAPRAYELGNQIAAHGIPVVYGGPHVTFLPNEAFERGTASYVIRGEGEESFPQLVEALEKGTSSENILGLSFKKKEGSIQHNPNAPLIRDLDSLPSIDYSLIHGIEDMHIFPVLTSRGCPYDCTFCSVTKMFGRGYRYRSTDKVVKELKYIEENYPKLKCFFFYDDHFAANPKRTKELLKAMKEAGIKTPWNAQIRVDIARDKELMKLFKATNCCILYIGVESINPATLRAYNKKQTIEDIEKNLGILQEYGFWRHCMFVFGADSDVIETIRETTKWAKKMDIETVQFLILTPLPGTPDTARLEKEGRIFDKDYSHYDAHHAVFRPKNMTAEELAKETYRAMRGFYSLPQTGKQLFSIFLNGIPIRRAFKKIKYRFGGRHLLRLWHSRHGGDYFKRLRKLGKKVLNSISEELPQ